MVKQGWNREGRLLRFARSAEIERRERAAEAAAIAERAQPAEPRGAARADETAVRLQQVGAQRQRPQHGAGGARAALERSHWSSQRDARPSDAPPQHPHGMYHHHAPAWRAPPGGGRCAERSTALK